MTRDRRYISVVDTAKLLRSALRQRFPGVKFSVRSSKYSGGASIRVHWTDGPTETEVRELTDLYTGASFDGMQDLKSYHDSILVDEDGTPELVHFGADYIFENREVSDEFLAVAAEWIDRRESESFAGETFQCWGGCPDSGWISEGARVWMARDDRGWRHVQCSPECAARVEIRYGRIRPAGSSAWRREGVAA